MQGIFNLPDTLQDDLDRFKDETERFKSGSTSAAEVRAFRVPQGVYEQREAEAFMLRVRFPAGAVLPHQMRTLAAVARTYGNAVLHVTSRQDIQVHNVPLESIHPALVELYAAGLSTKGGGGNTVRNVTACYDAGVCPREAFDVTPHAVAMTEFLLPDPLSFQLPRKYKLAFSGCSEDCAAATVNDLGFIAKRRNGEAGFAAYVGGGMGAMSRVADLLDEFVPATDICYMAEAVKRVFDKHGNRKDRRRARLRFLLEKIGIEQFRTLYEAELADVRKAAPAVPQARDISTPGPSSPEASGPPCDGFDAWREKNASPQKQPERYIVHVPLPLGDVTADTMEKLSDAVEAHGERMARTTQWQNLVIRWVHENELAALHRKLSELDLAGTPPPILRNTVACTGAATCKLGICLARGLARAVADRLATDGPDLEKLGDLSIHISGCPNSCGRHPLGDIGLFGAARRREGRLVPHYVVQLGGLVREGETRLGEGKQAVPAQNVPAFVAEFLKAFADSAQFPDYGAFLEAGGRETADRLAEGAKHVPPFEEDKNYYFDWGAESVFSLAGRGPGECGAGVFDLIDVDLASAHEALGAGRLCSATVLAARALLVTQAQEAKDDADALDLFGKHFIDADLVEDSFRSVIDTCRRAVRASNPEDAFEPAAGDVEALVETVQSLYDHMDPSLRFRPVEAEEAAPAPETVTGPEQEVDREADFHGVVCPLNYVKTKMVLDRMSKGQVLAIQLDDEGARKVPESAEKDGHEVVSVTQEGGRWRVVLRKG
ncbi:MAG: sulfurtransferase TusA family protein [Candidatus Brocadiia bacterium]|nr:sulfurtransferase TusA family protein [Candidatus Brocadiia bacterium]